MTLTDNTEAIREALRRARRTAATAVGEYITSNAKALCPYVSGNLRSSLSYQVSDMGEKVDIGTNVEYAEKIEFGGSPVKAPDGYLRKVANDNVPEIVGIIETYYRGVMS